MTLTNPEEALPEDDLEFLREKQHAYDVKQSEDGTLFVIFRSFRFGPGYRPETADLMVILPPGYPNAQVDMFWSTPDIMRANGEWPAASEHHEIHAGIRWQRWSRHFPAWRQGQDNLRSFMAAVRKELERGA